MIYEFLVEDIRDVELRVYVTGYRTMGESIVVLIKSRSSKDVYYSIAIDSFERKAENKKLINRTIEILDENGVSALNLMCWSHPDIDHSRGLGKLINSYCNEDTQILVPYGFHDPDFTKIKHNKSDRDFINSILEKNKPGKFKYSPVSVINGECNRVDRIRFVTPGDGKDDPPTEIAIYTLSPSGGLLNSRIFNNTLIDKNELSIVLAITIGMNRLIFGSDIMNDEIPYLEQEMLRFPQFVKIPHHGSVSSEVFLKYCQFDKKSSIACATSFDRHRLPDEAVMKKYVTECGQVDFTGRGKPGYYGEVEYSFDFFGDKGVNTLRHGNASTWASA